MLELLLLISIVALVVQFSWPAAVRWWRHPSPGSIGTGEFDSQGPIAKKYLLYLPDQGAGPWPLIVFLHGSSERGNNPNVLRDLGPLRYLKRASLTAVVAAPQCLRQAHWEPAAVVGFVEHLASRYHVDPKRIYLVGYSMGGYGVWQTAAAYSTKFAAIAPIAGGSDPDEANALVKLPIWAFHGERDEIVPIAQSEQIVNAVRAAGGSPRLTIMPKAGHGICHDVCNRTDLWQ